MTLSGDCLTLQKWPAQNLRTYTAILIPNVCLLLRYEEKGLDSKEVLVKDKCELLGINSSHLINILFIREFSRKTDVIFFKELGDPLLINQGSSKNQTKPERKQHFKRKGVHFKTSILFVSCLLCISKENSKN